VRITLLRAAARALLGDTLLSRSERLDENE
jgi:hypothetical protein